MRFATVILRSTLTRCGWLLALWGGLICAPLVAGEMPRPRVSGIVLTGADGGFAVVELPDRTSATVRVGDAIPGWGRVVAVRHDCLRVRGAGDGERALCVEDGADPPTLVAPIEPPPEETLVSAQLHARAQAAAALLYREMRRLAASPDADWDDASYALTALLELPATARVVAVNHQPVSRDQPSLSMLTDLLDQGTTVRLSLEGVEGVDSFYLSPPPVSGESSAGSQGAGEGG